MEDEKIRNLLRRYTTGKCTEEERAQVESWYNREAEKQDVMLPLPDLVKLKAQHWNTMFPSRRLRVMLWSSAAAAVILIGLALYLFRVPFVPGNGAGRDVIPAEQVLGGTNGAVLTLSDGREIVLSEHQTVAGFTDNGLSIQNKAAGMLVYSPGESNASEGLNTVSTPNGGQYQLILPDGTHVWLNSLTKLSYRPGVNKGERKVELDGEAYFEVAHDDARPFVVSSGGQDVRVLGTHFNISSYSNDNRIGTTLYQGSVRLERKGETVTLVPGDEAVVPRVGSGGFDVGRTNEPEGPAWRTGKIFFRDEALGNILRMAARWYDIDVVYAGSEPAERFTGGISRTANLKVLLDVLSSSGIRFIVEQKGGRKRLVVEP